MWRRLFLFNSFSPGSAISLLQAVAIFLVLAGNCGAEERIPGQWTRLEYGMELPSLGGGKLTVALSPEVHEGLPPISLKETGFTVKLSWLMPDGDKEAFKQLKLRLHYPDGRVVEPINNSPPITLSGGVITSMRFFAFPWGENALEEAWLALEDGERTYWLEVPYGFTRNPQLPLPSSEATDDMTPRCAPAMLQATPEDVDIIRWSEAHYDFGQIADDMHLEARLTHAACKLRLRRTKGRWSIHDPVTTVHVEKDDGGTIKGELIASRISNPGDSPSDREDEFTFDFQPLKGRNWGDLVITVGGTPHRRTIPLGTFLEGIMSVPSSR